MPLHQLLLQGGDKEQSQGSVSQLSHQLQPQEVCVATSPQQLRHCQRPSSCRWGLKEQAGDRRDQPQAGACPGAAGDSDELRLCPSEGERTPGAGTSPRRAGGGSLPSRLQPSFLCSPSLLELSTCPVCSPQAAGLCFVLHLGALPCLSPCSCCPESRCQAPAGDSHSHTRPWDSMGCQESSVWHGLRWRWEQTALPRGSALSPS